MLGLELELATLLHPAKRNAVLLTMSSIWMSQGTAVAVKWVVVRRDPQSEKE